MIIYNIRRSGTKLDIDLMTQKKNSTPYWRLIPGYSCTVNSNCVCLGFFIKQRSNDCKKINL